jgi:hypothetical protein
MRCGQSRRRNGSHHRFAESRHCSVPQKPVGLADSFMTLSMPLGRIPALLQIDNPAGVYICSLFVSVRHGKG